MNQSHQKTPQTNNMETLKQMQILAIVSIIASVMMFFGSPFLIFVPLLSIGFTIFGFYVLHKVHNKNSIIPFLWIVGGLAILLLILMEYYLMLVLSIGVSVWYIILIGSILQECNTDSKSCENSTDISDLDKLEKLSELMTKGVITKEEFEKEKKKILNNN